MRVKVIGVKRVRGIKEGRPYDFSKISYLRAIEPVATETFNVQGYGLEVGEFDLDKDALLKFSDLKFPADLDLTVDNVPTRRGLQAVVTGFQVPQVPRAAA